MAHPGDSDGSGDGSLGWSLRSPQGTAREAPAETLPFPARIPADRPGVSDPTSRV